MERPICVLAVIYIIIIIMLHLNGVVFGDYNKIYKYINSTSKYQGIIIEEKKEKEYKYVYVIQIKSQDKIINNKKFILNVKKNSKNKLEYGDKIEFIGEYRVAEGKRNYGGYDYSLYLKSKKIYGTFECNYLKVMSKNNRNTIKKYIKNLLKENLSKEQAELCIGILLGDKSELSDGIQQNFKKSNLTHMIAVSGAHFSYVILLITYINKILKRKRLGQVITIISIILFMNITNNTASVVRAGTMSIMIILASIFHRKPDVWNNIAVSILVQMINNPYVIFDIGFQLSYAGVIGIILFYSTINNIIVQIKDKMVQKEENRIIDYIIKSISITMSANVIIMPIIMLNFNTVSLTFVISNLLASPLLGIIIIISFILIFLSIFIKPLLKPFFYLLNLLLSLLLKITEICSKLPLSIIYVVTPNIVLIIIFYMIVILIKRKSSKKLIVSLILVILLNFIYPIISSNKINLEINFIDVGQGDSTLVRINNKNILIDSGGSTNDEFDIGERTLFPYLLDRGIICLDYIVVSHFDSDHCKAFEYLMKNMKIKNAIISKLGQESEEFTTFLKLAKENKTNIVFVKKRRYYKNR